MERRTNTTENRHSNPETFEQQWSHMKGQAKSWWDRLTDADLEQIGGQKAQLIRLVQERYGYARERAEQEVERRLGEYQGSGEGMASSLAASAGAVGTRVQDMATAAASSVAGTVSSAGSYLPDMPTDVGGLIRRHPIPALLIGLGVGFLLGRTLGQSLLSSWGGQDREERARQRETGYPDATIQCVRCGQMVRQSDMVSHSATCPGTGTPVGHGGSPT